MTSKIALLIFILVLSISNASCSDSYCYRNNSGNLFCEKSLDFVPQEYRATAFYKKINSSPNNSPKVDDNIGLKPQYNGLPKANSYQNEKTPSSTIRENNLPSRIKQNGENDYNNIDSQPLTELPIQNQPSKIKSPRHSKSNVPQIEVFVAKWCPHCKLLEAFLNKENISYIRYDVEQDEYGREVFEEENGGIPITKIGGTTVIGFEERKFKSLIDAQQPY